MAKAFLLLLVTGSIFFQGCAMAQNKSIDEILSTVNPDRFKPLDVTPIVLRYIPPGTERQAVIAELTAQGFEVKEAEQKIERCADCEPMVVLGWYINKTAFGLLPLPDKSYISLRFGFKNGMAVYISAIHTLNVY